MQGRTPLNQAAKKGHTSVVRLLLAVGANPNKVDGEVRGFQPSLGTPATRLLLTEAG